MEKNKLLAWLTVAIILEFGIAVMAFSAMGKRRSNIPGEGNKIARLVMENPSALESFIFYFILGHVLIGIIFLVGWLQTRRNARRK